jgi:excinuclease ABC subunit C
MVSKVRDIDHLPTSTSAEALLYENSLIKQYRPRYNVALRDDKSYPMLKLTVNERFPRLMITRRKKDDGALYYGPYSSAGLLKEALSIMRRIFPLRTCGRFGKNLCLSFHIGQCLGPCVGKVGERAYEDLVEEVRLFLEGKRPELIEFVSRRMRDASETQEFEEANRLKNRLEALQALRDKRVLYSPQADLEELRNVLGLPSAPEIVEAFDVSNIMGTLAVGSMIYFYKGRPKKSEYKRFRIKTIGSIDDYGMMRELVRRRYTRTLEEKRQLPDLVLIDGGKGHLQAALEELSRLGIRVPTIAIAKELEKIYMEDKGPLLLPRDSKALHLLQRIRDEAHRFAISYHKLLMSKRVVYSELDAIRGIGPKRKRELLAHFSSVEKIKKASLEELAKVRGMNAKVARSIIDHFKE